VEEGSQLGSNILRLTAGRRGSTGKVPNGVIGEFRVVVTVVGCRVIC
jgi:hypothetical protein